MKWHFVSHTTSLVTVFALIVPACGGNVTESSNDSPSLEEGQYPYISVPDVPPDDGNPNNNTPGGSTSGPAELDVVFENCLNVTRRNEMQDALEDVLAHWTAFQNNLEDRGLTTEHDCMHDRLTQNGNVHCEGCDVAGHSTALGQTAYICRGWAAGIEDRYPTSSNSRRVCWASVIMHEFGHNCERFEGGAELVDDAARETLNDIYGLSIDFDSECNQDL